MTRAPNDAVIVGVARTAIGRAPKGALRNTRPDDLASIAMLASIQGLQGLALSDIDDVILGCASPELEQGLNVARISALRAGFPDSVPGLTVNRFCASGLEAIAIAAAKIETGQSTLIVAGGVESMSMVPFMGSSLRPNPYLEEQLPDTYLSMGLSVERLALLHGITREAADAYAVESHRKAVAAQQAGRLAEEITSVTPTIGDEASGDAAGTVFDRDESPRSDTSMETLGRLKPAFSEDGTITAGNASPRSDGAAAVVLTTRTNAEEHGWRPLGRFAGYAVAAVAPADFGIAPASAIPKLLERKGLTIRDIELIEFNEAFAAQVLASARLFPLPMDRVNVNGGALALGHPLGATGARQTISMVHEARRRSAHYGVVTMCAALGMGAAGLFEFES